MGFLRSFIPFMIPVFVFLGCAGVEQGLESKVKGIAGDLQKALLDIRAGGESLAKDISALYDREDTLDLSTDALDQAQGGPFELFQPGNYYQKKDKTGAAYYLAPYTTKDEVLRKELRHMMHLENLLVNFNRQKDLNTPLFYGIHQPQAIAMIYPWVDVVANFPPGLVFDRFEWYQRGLKSSGSGVWSPSPFTNLMNGWVVDVSIPTFRQGTVKGVLVLSLAIDALVSKNIAGETEALILLGPQTEVLGQSPAAKTLGGFAEIDLVNLIRQTKENSFVPEVYQLIHKDQTPVAQGLGQKLLAGERSFSLILEGRKVAVRASEVPEIHFLVVGLAAE